MSCSGQPLAEEEEESDWKLHDLEDINGSDLTKNSDKDEAI